MRLKEIMEAIKSVRTEAKRKGLSAKEIDDLRVDIGSWCEDCEYNTSCTSFEASFQGEGAGDHTNCVDIIVC